MRNICLYTMHNWQTIGAMAAMTVPNKIEYCRRHGYAYHEEVWTKAMFPGFERLPVLIHLLKCGHFDWIFWLGTDALITNLSVPVESLIDDRAGIIVAADFNQIQLDSFLIQRRCGGLEIMERVWEHHEIPIGQWYEQSTLHALMREREFSKTVKFVPQRRMNAYHHAWYSEFPESRTRRDVHGHDGEWQRGDFVFHIPGRPLEIKLRALKKVLPLIQR